MIARGNPQSDERLAEALARGDSIQDAAKACGISESTVRRRKQDPGFQAKVAQLSGGMLGRSVGHVIRTTLAAAQAFEDLLSVKTPAHLLDADARLLAVRLATAKAVFDTAFRGHDVLDLAERFRQLQERLRAAGHDV